MILFALLGTIMYVSKVLMAWAPNLHLLGLLIMTYTLVYRTRALIPIYIYVLLEGFFSGFAPWWIPYLYVWTVLWGVTMLLPKKMPDKVAFPVYMAVCALHGLSFGTLYAPAQALLFRLPWRLLPAWIASGFYFDLLHAGGNLVAATLILPLTKALTKLENK